MSTPPSNRAYGWLWLVVALQVAIPASYYFGRNDPDDERFAWRMFSAVRVKRCEVELREQRDGRFERVRLEPILHGGWRNALKRGRKRVIARLLEQRCREPGVEAAELVRTCKSAAGKRLPRERTLYTCAAEAWEFEGRTP